MGSPRIVGSVGGLFGSGVGPVYDAGHSSPVQMCQFSLLFVETGRGRAARTQCVVTSLSPTIPAMITLMHSIRTRSAGSSNSTMPSSAVPTMPTPVQTA
jgi:hypothetical protein